MISNESKVKGSKGNEAGEIFVKFVFGFSPEAARNTTNISILLLSEVVISFTSCWQSS